MNITQIPNRILDMEISTTALAVYVRLIRHWPSGQFNATAEQMADVCQVSRPTICRALEELTEVGIFESKMRLKVSFEE